jgi:hypothetical protein
MQKDAEPTVIEQFEPFELTDLIQKMKEGIAIEKIPKPDGSGGRQFNVRESIGLSHDSTWYNDILVSYVQCHGLFIRNLICY